jgi:hypothetical protein
MGGLFSERQMAGRPRHERRTLPLASTVMGRNPGGGEEAGELAIALMEEADGKGGRASGGRVLHVRFPILKLSVRRARAAASLLPPPSARRCHPEESWRNLPPYAGRTSAFSPRSRRLRSGGEGGRMRGAVPRQEMDSVVDNIREDRTWGRLSKASSRRLRTA